MSHPGGKSVYTFYVTLCDGKLGENEWYFIKVCDATVKKISMKYFYSIKDCIYGMHNPKKHLL